MRNNADPLRDGFFFMSEYVVCRSVQQSVFRASDERVAVRVMVLCVWERVWLLIGVREDTLIYSMCAFSFFFHGVVEISWTELEVACKGRGDVRDA